MRHDEDFFPCRLMFYQANGKSEEDFDGSNKDRSKKCNLSDDLLRICTNGEISSSSRPNIVGKKAWMIMINIYFYLSRF